MRRTIGLAVVSGVLAVIAVGTGEGAGSKAINLAACPPQGAEKKGTSRAALNEVKHRVPAATTPLLLTFTDFPELQQQADAKVTSGTGAKVSAKQRAAKLRGLSLGARTVGEGDLVSIVGFVV